MTTPSSPVSGGSTMLGFFLILAMLVIAYMFGTSAVAQVGGPVSPYLTMPPAAPPSPLIWPPVTPAAPPVTTTATPAPAATAATIPVYLPQPSYRDEGYSQDDEVPIRCVGTVRIRRNSGAFRAEGSESIANALLVKEKIANQGQQAFEAALAKGPVTTTVVTTPVTVLTAPIPHFVGYRVLGPRIVIDSRNCRWVYSGGYWHL